MGSPLNSPALLFHFSHTSEVSRRLKKKISMDPSSSVPTIVVAVVMFFFLLAAFVFFIYVFARYRWASSSAARQDRVHAAAAAAAAANLATCTTGRGLDQEVLRSLPVLVFKRENHTETLECSVCLSEIADGEKARLLPKCNHGFHINCIDKWFRSHTTCPLCRNPVEAILDVGHSSEPWNLPTNVLFWGSQDRVSANIATGGCSKENHEDNSSSSSSSSSSPAFKMEGTLVIDIPDSIGGEETKSQAATPTSARLRSLKRFLSREKKAVAGSSAGSSGGEAQDATAEDQVRP